ncbi:MAG: hypothetical protein ACI9OH_003102 [Oleispira sp.]|jgi:hypothetical protein
MKKLTVSQLAIVFSSLFLTACSSMFVDEDSISSEPEAFFQPVEQEIDPIAPMVLRVVGYGAMVKHKTLTESQSRLMAIRASKLDAYRSMVERVYGTALQGSTTVRDLAVQNDRFRTYVDTYIHGARVISSDVMADGTVETLLEMVIDQGFRNCLQTMDSQRYNVDCRAPLGNDATSFAHSQRKRIQKEATIPETGYYFID